MTNGSPTPFAARGQVAELIHQRLLFARGIRLHALYLVVLCCLCQQRRSPHPPCLLTGAAAPHLFEWEHDGELQL